MSEATMNQEEVEKNDDLFNWCVFESMVSYLFKYGIGNETLIELEELFEEDAWISTEEFFLMLEKVIFVVK